MIKITSLHAARGDSARISQDFNDVLWSERKDSFTQNIWVRVKPRQALFIIQNFVTASVAAKCQQR